MSLQHAVLAAVMGFAFIGCSSKSIAGDVNTARNVAANEPARVDPMDSPLITDLINSAATMSCAKVQHANAADDDATGTALRSAYGAYIRDPRRLTNLDRKLKAINPEFRVVELPMDDVPREIQSRSYASANFKIIFQRKWMLLIVQDASNLFCKQSQP